MNALKTINSFRRFIMRGLTKKIGATRATLTNRLNNADQVIRILICRPNHRLGNLLMTTPMIQEVSDMFPQASIDLFVKGSVVKEIFQNYYNIRNIFQLPRKPAKALRKYIATWLLLKKNEYDLVINVDRNTESSRPATHIAN